VADHDVKLLSNTYGKSRVRLTKVARHPDGRHDLKELSVEILLTGDFAQTYITGDNTGIVATDSMKNTVYVLAKRHPIDSIESFGAALAAHFVQTYPQVSGATVSLEQSLWHRIDHDGGPHPHAFVAGGNELRTCAIVNVRNGATSYHAGIRDLLVLKTTNSAFKGYVRDAYTTLPETEDRIFATSVKADWDYVEGSGDWNERFDTMRSAMLDVFAEHRSYSVQQTLYEMGKAALARCPAAKRIRIEMPNQHRIPFNFAPFGLKFENDIFVPTDEPHGTIVGEIGRE